MARIRAEKEAGRRRRNFSISNIEARRIRNASNSGQVVIINQKPTISNGLDLGFKFALLNCFSNSVVNTVKAISTKNTVIMKESRGINNMTDNELRNSIKEQAGMVIDNIYEKFSNAENLKPKTKYIFTITITDPITKEHLKKEFGLYGEDIMGINKFMKENPVKAKTIKRVLKKEAWKIAFSMFKENK